VAFLAVHQGLFGIYTGSSFAPNHKGMTYFGPGGQVDYLGRQVLPPRNTRGGPVTDFALGRLNYQIEHHLFPSIAPAEPAARPRPWSARSAPGTGSATARPISYPPTRRSYAT
jgi:hypothetical protein